MDSLFNVFSEGCNYYSQTIPVAQGRTLKVDVSSGRVARFNFDVLFRSPLGASDFLALASKFHTIFVDGVPRLDSSAHNDVRRFIIFIDILYENKCLFICSSEVPLDQIFRELNVTLSHDERIDRDSMAEIPRKPFSHPKSNHTAYELNTSTLSVRSEGGSSGRLTTMIGEAEWSATGLIGVSLAELASVKDVGFSFRRALSRIVEMQSLSYQRGHRKHYKLV